MNPTRRASPPPPVTRSAWRAEARASLDGAALDARLREIADLESGEHLRSSFLARMGRGVEPVVAPLGWDWKIGMATIAAFPARELIVSSLNIIYDLGEEGGEGGTTLRSKLREARRPDGSPTFTIAVALSILVFVALCCQCASTLAVMYRETHALRWPILAFTYLTVLAYVGALVTYQIATAAGL
jgi:ferrous iron transport protein B